MRRLIRPWRQHAGAETGAVAPVSEPQHLRQARLQRAPWREQGPLRPPCGAATSFRRRRRPVSLAMLLLMSSAAVLARPEMLLLMSSAAVLARPERQPGGRVARLGQLGLSSRRLRRRLAQSSDDGAVGRHSTHIRVRRRPRLRPTTPYSCVLRTSVAARVPPWPEVPAPATHGVRLQRLHDTTAKTCVMHSPRGLSATPFVPGLT